MIKFSFIVPVYNVENYLRRCIDSILNQSYENYEIILVNDGSTDNSGKICNEYIEKDSRIKVIHQNNLGVSIARNKGIELSSGDYIIFIDSDDFFIKDSLKDIYKSIDKDIDLVVFNYQVYDNKTSKVIKHKGNNLDKVKKFYVKGNEYLEDILMYNNLYQWYIWHYAIKKEILINNNLKFKEDKKYEDVDIMYKIILSSNKVKIVDEVFLRYGVYRTGSITQQTKLSTELDKLEVISDNINIVNSLEINKNLKSMLTNNLSCTYYSTLILINDIKDKNEKKILLNELKKRAWVCKYTTTYTQLAIYKLSKLIGIRNTCKILNIRRKIKEKF